ncbi:hypothetical protein N9R79_01645 [Vibrio sp.]|nr:hypothetical protein [Vibrio sp.]
MMKYAQYLLLMGLSATSMADEMDYLNKIDVCVSQEQAKPELTQEEVTLNDFKYLPILKQIRISKCTKSEEEAYLRSTDKSQQIKTLSDYLHEDLQTFDPNELEEMKALNTKLASFSLEGDLISLHDKVQKKQNNGKSH